jgi:hypothetical protein
LVFIAHLLDMLSLRLNLKIPLGFPERIIYPFPPDRLPQAVLSVSPTRLPQKRESASAPGFAIGSLQACRIRLRKATNVRLQFEASTP